MPHSQAVEYVGLTQTTLSRRLTYHGQEGGIFSHFEKCHNSKPTREQLTGNTVVIGRAPDRNRLAIKEALHILNLNPSINKQYDNFANVLKLYKQRNAGTKSSNTSEIVNAEFPGNLSPIPSENKSSSSPSLVTSNIDSFMLPTPENNSNCFNHENTLEPTLENTQSNPELPDMYKVLCNFGIDPSRFREVPLEDYKWKEVPGNPIVEELTISQRIKSMRRNVKHNKSHQLES